MRTANIQRKTKETDIEVRLGLESGQYSPEGVWEGAPPTEHWQQNTISTGIGFLDHMLDALGRHANLALNISCKGDLHIDQHHTVEDVGIALGQAFSKALGDMTGIERFAMMECPLDEALVKCVVDLSGRPYLHYGLKYQRPFIGALDSSLLREFFGGFVSHAKWTVHLDMVRGENDHHTAEAAFKAFARAVRSAVRQTGLQSIPSTKGVL